jgi:hypothetical protein
MKYLLIALLFAVSTASASPQIYPSGIQYMGTGELSITISVYNPKAAPVNAELVLVKDLRQHPKDDITISSVELRKNQDKRIPVTFDIKSNPKPFFLCVKSYENTQAIRDCSVIQQRKIK